MNKETIEKLAALKRDEYIIKTMANHLYHSCGNGNAEYYKETDRLFENQKEQLELIHKEVIESKTFDFKPILNQFLDDIKTNYLKGEDELYNSIEQFEKFISDKEISIDSLDISGICK